MIAAFELMDSRIRHLIVYEVANGSGKAITLCGKAYSTIDGRCYASIPKRVGTCVECRATLDETRRLLGS